MWPSSTSAFASNVPWASRGFNVVLSLSAQAVSFLKATNPPSLSGTINWRRARSWEVTTMGDAKAGINRASTRANALLLIVVTPPDDRQLDLISRPEAREAQGGFVCGFFR